MAIAGIAEKNEAFGLEGTKSWQLVFSSEAKELFKTGRYYIR